MTTQADTDLDKARGYVETTIQLLGDIVIGRTEGHDDYRDSFKVKIKQAFDSLLYVREQLK